MKFPREVIHKLKCYVYAYIDPRNKEIFYIGKGTGNRAFAHLTDTSEGKKVERIRKIKARGMEPLIEILRYGLSSAEAEIAEAAAIDAVGLHRLTNKMRGMRSKSLGRTPAKELILAHEAPIADLKHAAVLITIAKLFRFDMTPEQLYDATRGVWALDPKRLDDYPVSYAMAIFDNIIREVYQVKQWYPGGTTDFRTRDHDDVDDAGRWEFVGTRAPQSIRSRYVGYRVPPSHKSGQNPIRYFEP